VLSIWVGVIWDVLGGAAGRGGEKGKRSFENGANCLASISYQACEKSERVELKEENIFETSAYKENRAAALPGRRTIQPSHAVSAASSPQRLWFLDQYKKAGTSAFKKTSREVKTSKEGASLKVVLRRVARNGLLSSVSRRTSLPKPQSDLYGGSPG